MWVNVASFVASAFLLGFLMPEVLAANSAQHLLGLETPATVNTRQEHSTCVSKTVHIAAYICAARQYTRVSKAVHIARQYACVRKARVMHPQVGCHCLVQPFTSVFTQMVLLQLRGAPLTCVQAPQADPAFSCCSQL